MEATASGLSVSILELEKEHAKWSDLLLAEG